MKSLTFILLGLCLLLTACGRPAQAPAASKEKPLFTDAVIDNALLRVPSEVKELVGVEENAAEGQTLFALPKSQSEIGTQAVLPNTSGFVYYLKVDQNVILGTVPYSLYRHNQRTDTRELVYSGDRSIQSVAGNGDGTMIVVSMKETTDIASDFDIYLFNISDPNNPATFLLSPDSVDNTNVSMSADTNRIVYEEPIAGKAAVVIRTKQPFAFYDSVVINHPDPQRHPSVSANGQFITLVRDLSWGNDFVLTYNLATNGYRGVISNAGLLEHPSISNDGNLILWLENGTTDRMFLKTLRLYPENARPSKMSAQAK